VTAYYNENDPFAYCWLEQLADHNLIEQGDFDGRSIEDVIPTDLSGYTQAHFFAGIGVWSYALRQAGWPEGQEVWTGSCPCQPFSTAGKGQGFADERHLWPAWFHLIQQRRPEFILGEQVAHGSAKAWVDLVQSDLEAAGYTFGATILPACGFGAPHLRARTYWVAHYGHAVGRSEREGRRRVGLPTGRPGARREVRHVADVQCERRQPEQHQSTAGVLQTSHKQKEQFAELSNLGASTINRDLRTRPTDGFWRRADWLRCTDERYRAVRPGTFPLANGPAKRVGRLRGYGNAIVAPVAIEFIKTVMEVFKIQ
jgi:DNA (cytosine-5)-methyltransferase 1